MRCHKFISLFGGVAAAWSFAAHAQDPATMGTTKAPTATSTQVEVARVKPVGQRKMPTMTALWFLAAPRGSDD